MTEAEQLEWFIAWRQRVRAAFRAWLNATSFRDGCHRLSQLKAVFNEVPPDHNPDRKEKGQ